jgi:glycosyltransferase involved in cell wall biosynthesis
LTVILATYNGAHVLPRTLSGYARQGDVGFSWKLIVVDNGSTDETPQIIREFATRLPLQALIEPVAGKNRALNTGLSAVEGEFVIVTDDDAIPQAGFLEGWWDASRLRPDYQVFGGSVRPSFEVAPPEWMSQSQAKFGELFALRDLPEGPVDPLGIYGPNMAVRRSVFRAGLRFDVGVGPNATDESYPMGSENEFCYRASSLGYKTWFVKKPEVWHIVRASQLKPDYWARRAYRLGRGVAYRGWASGSLVPQKKPTLFVTVASRAWRKAQRALLASRTLLPAPPLQRFTADWEYNWHCGFWDEYSRRKASHWSDARIRAAIPD